MTARLLKPEEAVRPCVHLMDYVAQNAALRRWMKAGLCEEAGTWQHGLRRGVLWHGEGFGFRWTFHTEGRRLVPGTFRVRAIPGWAPDKPEEA